MRTWILPDLINFDLSESNSDIWVELCILKLKKSCSFSEKIQVTISSRCIKPFGKNSFSISINWIILVFIHFWINRQNFEHVAVARLPFLKSEFLNNSTKILVRFFGDITLQIFTNFYTQNNYSFSSCHSKLTLLFFSSSKYLAVDLNYIKLQNFPNVAYTTRSLIVILPNNNNRT